MKTKTILKLIFFPLCLIGVLLAVAFFFADFSSDDELRFRLYQNEPASSIDVTFIGPSTVNAGIIPTEIFKNHHFTSYSVGFASMPLQLVRPILEQCEQKQGSKLYCIEMNNLTYTAKSNVTIKNFLNSITDKSLRNKYMDELVPKDSQFQFKDKLYANHNNWQSVGDVIAQKTLKVGKKKSVLKGFSFFLEQYPFDSSDVLLDAKDFADQTQTVLDENLEELEKLLQFIDENNLKEKVVFFKTPKFYVEGEEHKIKELNFVENFLKEKGFDVLNYVNRMDEFDLSLKDYRDYDHLLEVGARKFSNKIAADLIELKKISSTTHSAEIEENWNKCTQLVDEYIESQKNSKNKKVLYSDLSYFEYASKK